MSDRIEIDEAAVFHDDLWGPTAHFRWYGPTLQQAWRHRRSYRLEWRDIRAVPEGISP